jgi:sugar-specific transcriptional regulator TrmB
MNDQQPFDTTILRKAGLTESQAKGYLALIEHGALSPAELAEKTGETRTNGYMICEKLVSLGLATKKEGKKALYTPNHPSTIETLAERRRKIVQQNEQAIKNNLGNLIDYFYKKRDTPGVVTEVGRAGIERVYNEVLDDRNPVEILRSQHDSGYMSHEFYSNYALRRAKLGVVTTMLSPATKRSLARQTPTYDKDRGITHRYWLDVHDYTARVEWSVYGDKVSALTFGDEAISLTIYSKDIADSMRQIFQLVKRQSSPSQYSSPESPL